MISSLLSLYIASAIQPNISNEISKTEISRISTIQNSQIQLSQPPQVKKTVKKNEFISPIIEAKSAISIDLETGNVLFEKNIHDKRPMASITKLMTAKIILEENDIKEIATISATAASTEGSTMYLRTGEKISIENLIDGLIIQSANDAAVALAEHNAGSVKNFLEKMNQQAMEMGLVNTHFGHPAGLDHPDNYSSAHDIAKLGKEVYKNQIIQIAAQTKEKEVSSEDGLYKHKLTSTNILLDSYLNIKGLKTGRTNQAGLCMVAIAEQNGNYALTVVLDSPDRFKESKILIDWTFRAYNWI